MGRVSRRRSRQTERRRDNRRVSRRKNRTSRQIRRTKRNNRTNKNRTRKTRQMKRSKRNNRTNKNRKGNRRLVRKKIQAGGPSGKKSKPPKATTAAGKVVDYSNVVSRVDTKGPKRSKSKSPQASLSPLTGELITPGLGPGTGELSPRPLAGGPTTPEPDPDQGGLGGLSLPPLVRAPTTPEPDSLSSFLNGKGYVVDNMNKLPSGAINTVLEDVDRYIDQKKEGQDQSSRVQLLTIRELIDVYSDVFTSANVIEMLVQMEDGKPIEYEHTEIIRGAYTQEVTKKDTLRTRESPAAVHTLVAAPETYHTQFLPPI